eukprot:gene20400-22413_t
MHVLISSLLLILACLASLEEAVPVKYAVPLFKPPTGGKQGSLFLKSGGLIRPSFAEDDEFTLRDNKIYAGHDDDVTDDVTYYDDVGHADHIDDSDNHELESHAEKEALAEKEARQDQREAGNQKGLRKDENFLHDFVVARLGQFVKSQKERREEMKMRSTDRVKSLLKELKKNAQEENEDDDVSLEEDEPIQVRLAKARRTRTVRGNKQPLWSGRYDRREVDKYKRGRHGRETRMWPLWSGRYGRQADVQLLWSGRYGREADRQPFWSGRYGRQTRIRPLWSGRYGREADIQSWWSGRYGRQADMQPLWSGRYGRQADMQPLWSGRYGREADIQSWWNGRYAGDEDMKKAEEGELEEENIEALS